MARAIVGMWLGLGLVAGVAAAADAVEATPAQPDEIVVSAARMPKSTREVGVSVAVIPRARIAELNAQNVGAVLEQVADARVKSYGAMGAESGVALRGSSASQVLVLLDGRPAHPPSLGMVDLALLPADQVERIEVIRGPGSVLYGSGAMAGVVNIVSKDPPAHLQTEASAAYGTKNTRLLQLQNGATIGDLGYLITASHNASDGWRDNSACEGYHLTAKLDYDISLASRLILNAGFSQQRSGVPGSTSWASPEAKQYNRQAWVDLTHQYEFETNTWLTSKAFLNQDWLDYKDPAMWTDDSTHNQKAGLDIQQTLPLGERQLLLGGLYLEYDRVTIKDAQGASRIDGARQLWTGAGFLQDEISILEKLTATPGLRCDVQSSWGAELSPKLSALYKLWPGTGLKASVSRGFRAPTVNELYWRDDYTLGNRDLDPEESFSYDAGIQQALGDRGQLQMAVFQSHMRNLISWFDNGQGLYQAQNVDDALLRGVEVEIDAQLTREVSAAFHYTFLDAQDTSGEYDGQTLSYRPQHKLGGRLGYQSAWGLKLGLNADYTDAVYADRANTRELGGYLTLGAYAAQRLCEGVEIYCRADNILDKKYQQLDGYPMPGASVMGGVRAVF